MGEFVATGEVKHVGGEHQESPKHEHVDAACNPILQHSLLSEPTDNDLFDPKTPVVKSIFRASKHHQTGGFDDLIDKKAAGYTKQHEKDGPAWNRPVIHEQWMFHFITLRLSAFHPNGRRAFNAPSNHNELHPTEEKENKSRANVQSMVQGEGAITASAPGKCILFGEHAVVYGEPAVAVALEQRMRVDLVPSSAWSLNGAALSKTKHPHVWSLLESMGGGAAISPMDIHISGDIPRASGLGSSAALSASMVRGLEHRLGLQFTDEDAGRLAHEAEAFAQQGRASPMDTSASLLGGVVVLSDRREEGLNWRYERSLEGASNDVVWHVHDLDVGLEGLYLVIGNTGVHAPTLRQVNIVARALDANPELSHAIATIGAITRRGLAALKAGDAERVGQAMTENHLVLRSLGVSSSELERLVQAAAPSSVGVKMTGAGGGGCMVALTRDPETTRQAIELAGGEAMVSTFPNPGADSIPKQN